MPTVAKSSLPAGTCLEHYQIIEKIGEGGMGVVYLAKDLDLHRKVAVKVLPDELSQDKVRLSRFEQEAVAASALNHPNILTIHEIGSSGLSRFIVSEYVSGRTLREKIGTLSIPETIDIACQIASALEAAHRSGIIHRDIKPENIVIRDDGLVKVLDFGLAKLMRPPSSAGLTESTVGREHTAAGVILGTVNYMSPEQARGTPIDQRTDLFSLGAVIYEMVTGSTPFGAGSMPETFANLIYNEPRPLSHFVPGIPQQLEEIVSRLLRKDPQDRYASAKDLAADLKDLQAHLTLPADAEKATALIDLRSAGTERGMAGATGLRKKSRIIAAAAVTVLVTLGIIGAVMLVRRPGPETQPQIRSLAVLPLRSLDKSDDLLSLGITDAVIRRISQTGELVVRPTSSVRRFLTEDSDAFAAAKELGVDSVLEGTVQRSGGRARITVNLLRVSDGVSLWTEQIETRSDDIFDIQDLVAQKVATHLQLRLDPVKQAALTKRHTASVEAYEYYLKGKASEEQRTVAVGDVRAIQAAIASFKKAVEIDPNYAPAYAALAYDYMWIANFNDPGNTTLVGLAHDAANKADAIDPSLAETRRMRFEYYFSQFANWDIAQAAREAKRAIEINPAVGHAELGTLYDHVGLNEDMGIAAFRRELEIDPTNVFNQQRYVEALNNFGRFDEADRESRRYFDEPSSQSLIGRGRVGEALPLLERKAAQNPGNLVISSWLAVARALNGRTSEAEAAIPVILENADRNRAYHHITYNIACIYALSGKTSSAVKWLRTTADNGMPNYPLFQRDPKLDRIRNSPEFTAFIDELNKQWNSYRAAIE